MKRFLATTLMLGACSTFGFMGCADESKVKESQEVSTPGGTVEKTTETTIKQTGDNPPPTTTGESATAPPAK